MNIFYLLQILENAKFYGNKIVAIHHNSVDCHFVSYFIIVENYYYHYYYSGACLYKGQVYQQGQTWQDGCDYECECTDASKGQYKCTERYVCTVKPVYDAFTAGKSNRAF